MNADDIRSAFTQLGRRELVAMMHEQLDELLASRDQMELLLRVVVQIGSDLDLEATLRRVITAAMSLTGATYGALGLRAADGRLASFLHAGMDADMVRRIGWPPQGKGLLGALLGRTEPLRLEDLSQHPAAAGFPQHHPPMQAFLGVPIVIRGAVFGSLYLSHVDASRVFSESDQVAASALASAAAFAIENAQLFDRVRRSAKWTSASREITTALLSGTDDAVRPMQMIVERALELTQAEQAIVLVPADSERPLDDIDTLVVSAAVGLFAGEVLGQRVPVAGSTTGGVFRSGKPLITDAFQYPIVGFTDVGERPAIVMPLHARDTVLGVIAVARNANEPQFDPDFLEVVSDFAGHAAMALTLAAGREHARELTILADRERIAHDLHDHVIQRLFAAGMDLQGTMALSRSPEVSHRLNRTLDALQSTIDDIRTTIFDLRSSPVAPTNIRQRIQEVVAELTAHRDLAVTLHFAGPLTAAAADLVDHAEAVVAEAVSNALRHSGGTTLTIDVVVDDRLTIDVVDNGRGIRADETRRSGLANLQHRAEQAFGTCEITSAPSGGTCVHWSAPIVSG